MYNNFHVSLRKATREVALDHATKQCLFINLLKQFCLLLSCYFEMLVDIWNIIS